MKRPIFDEILVAKKMRKNLKKERQGRPKVSRNPNFGLAWRKVRDQWGTIGGLRIDSENYSAHKTDREYLLKDGIQMWVLGVDEQKIENVDSQDTLYKEFDGKSITFVHLCRLG